MRRTRACSCRVVDWLYFTGIVRDSFTDKEVGVTQDMPRAYGSPKGSPACLHALLRAAPELDTLSATSGAPSSRRAGLQGAGPEQKVPPPRPLPS